jgi:hypothetical protein
MTNFKRLLMMIAAVATLSFNSCKKDNFDEPPYNSTDPGIANTTIADLRSLFTSGNPITINDDLIIGGIVTADDKTGNFYKTIVIQDETGALPILINKSGLNADYPVGRKVYIKCKGLVLGQYGSNVQLGGYIDVTGSQPSVGNIPSAITDKVVIKGPYASPVQPLKITRISDLDFTSDQSLLIELDPVEFLPSDANQIYADVINENSLSRNIKDCFGDIIAIRTSNFASFANNRTPSAGTKLKIIGVYSVFNSTRQLAIRDVVEVQNTTTPCGVDPGLTTISIADLKALYTTVGLPLVINSDSKISGIVTANDRSGNFYKQIVIQDATGAIPILINKKELYKQFEIGRRIYVSVNGLVIGQYGKNIQLGGYVDSSSATPAVGDISEALIPNRILNGALETPIIPRKISSLADLNLTSDQSTLVELDPVSFLSTSVGRSFADIINGVSLSRKVQDCDNNTLDIRTSNFAEFANTNTPSGSLSIIGVYSIFNTSKQLTIRELNEVVTSTSSCPVILLSEDFETTSGSGIISLPNWTNYATAGTKNWTSTGTTNKNARFSAFSTTSQQPSNIGWLITPSINMNLSTNESLYYRRSIGFVTGTIKMEILFSTDYISGDPSTSTWTLLLDDAPLATTTFTNATPISLNTITGTNVHFAFRYTGGYGPDNTTQYNLDNIIIK